MMALDDGWDRSDATAAGRKEGEMKFSARSLIALLGAVVVLLASGVGRAELQRVEAVGIYGIRDSQRSRVIPRDEAIAKARWEGVSRVARELIGESAPSDDGQGSDGALEPVEPSKDDAAALEAALGSDVLPYMRSYRILDDRGEVPVLFNDEPNVTVEYVVVVEVIVDVDRVTKALENAGLVAMVSSEDNGQAVIVELVGLSRYEALEVVLEALRTQFGATRIRTLEFSHERQILAIEGPFGPEALSAKLAGFEDPRLLLEPIGVDSDGGRIRLMGRWFPDSDESQDGSGSESKPNRVPAS